MKDGDNAWPSHRRAFIVDVLIGTSAVTVAFAAMGATADVQDLLIFGASALVGIGLMLEPRGTARDIGLQPLRSPEGPGYAELDSVH
jgi:hypothetical protein